MIGFNLLGNLGRLGNQMFQYSFADYISKKTGRKIVIDLSNLNNKNFIPNFTYRDYDLDIFNINVETINHFNEPYELIQEDWNQIHSVQYDLISKALPDLDFLRVFSSSISFAPPLASSVLSNSFST